jgi:hypothetical protein
MVANDPRLSFGGDFRLVSLSPLIKFEDSNKFQNHQKPRFNLNRCYRQFIVRLNQYSNKNHRKAKYKFNFINIIQVVIMFNSVILKF